MDINTIDQLEALCGQLGIPVPPPPPPEPSKQPASEPEVYRPAEGIECWCPCDFRNLPVGPGTVDAVITDIPYDVPGCAATSPTSPPGAPGCCVPAAPW